MKTIKHTYTVKALPEEVFRAITNPFTIELWSGYPAKMEAVENGEFSIFEGSICGKNIKIVPDKQLVQEWYFGENVEQSLVTINLIAVKSKTKVELCHTNVPDEVYEEFEKGWRNYYWGAIIEYFK